MTAVRSRKNGVLRLGHRDYFLYKFVHSSLNVLQSFLIFSIEMPVLHYDDYVAISLRVVSLTWSLCNCLTEITNSTLLLW